MGSAAWAHLPNAVAIDDIFADVKARPKAWREAGDVTWGEAWGIPSQTAWDLAKHTVEHTGRGAIWNEAWNVMWAAAKGTPRSTAWIVISALIAWDSSADMLSLTPDALRTIIDTCDGDVKHHAVLLLPAVIARHTT